MTVPLDTPTLRPAGATDLDTLIDLETQCFQPSWTEEMVEASLRTTGSVVLLASEPTGDRPRAIGSAFFHVVLDEAELLRIAVVPAARRRGLGARLLERGLEQLARQGASTCHLEVAEDNHPALALYRTFGFEVVGHRPAYYPSGADALLMAVEL